MYRSISSSDISFRYSGNNPFVGVCIKVLRNSTDRFKLSKQITRANENGEFQEKVHKKTSALTVLNSNFKQLLPCDACGVRPSPLPLTIIARRKMCSKLGNILRLSSLTLPHIKSTCQQPPAIYLWKRIPNIPLFNNLFQLNDHYSN